MDPTSGGLLIDADITVVLGAMRTLSDQCVKGYAVATGGAALTTIAAKTDLEADFGGATVTPTAITVRIEDATRAPGTKVASMTILTSKGTSGAIRLFNYSDLALDVEAQTVALTRDDPTNQSAEIVVLGQKAT